MADHTRGGDEDFLLLASGQLRGGFDCRIDNPVAGDPRKGIRIALIDDDGADLAARQYLAAPVDRRGRAFRRCKDPGDGRACGKAGHHHVLDLRVGLQADMLARGGNARDFGYRGKTGRGKRGFFQHV